MSGPKGLADISDEKIKLGKHQNSDHPIYVLILNDFASIFHTMALQYFSHKVARQASRSYYRNLAGTIGKQGDAIERMVSAAMSQSIVIWKGLDRMPVVPNKPKIPEAVNGALERLG